jgi:arylsulfatase A-like enzyme
VKHSFNRRSFVKSIAAAPAALEVAAQGAPSQSRPNVLFFIADDLTFRTIHRLNNEEVQTPNLDRLVKRGCAFTHCFHQGSWSDAVCVPSRTMLNTGLSTFRATSWVPLIGDFQPESPIFNLNADGVQTWGQTLGNAGYRTYIVGKWHLSPTLLQRSFQEMGPVGPGMFASTPSAYNRHNPGNTWTPWDRNLEGHWLPTKLWLNRPGDGLEHTSVVWSSCAVDHLLKNARRPEPFFMYVGFHAPHDPRQAPKEFVDRYPHDSIQIPPNYLPEHPFDQGDRLVRDELLAPFPRTKAAVKLHRSEYYAIITHMDQQLGRVLDALERSGKASNTYVIFTADHGLAVGQHGLMGKQNMYDHSIRIPLLISGPGIPAGKRIDDLVYQHSVFPTTCELAGVPVPKTVEFPSLAPLLRGSATPVHDSVFCRYRNFQRAVRTREHKLIVYPQIGRVQLFDLREDPWEVHDRSADAKFSTLKRDLMARLKQHQRELGDELDLERPAHAG